MIESGATILFYGIILDLAGDFNPKMYNSFTDGTKAAIEMAAVANATGLDCPEEGLSFY